MLLSARPFRLLRHLEARWGLLMNGQESCKSLQIARRQASSSSSHKEDREHHVLLTAVPLTVTPSDIGNLASIVTQKSSSGRSLSNSITDIALIRTPLLNASGKALVSFRKRDSAREFAKAARGRSLGGQTIGAAQLDSRPEPAAPVVSLLAELQKRSPGRVVLLKGLPNNMLPERVHRILSSGYALAQDQFSFDLKTPNSRPRKLGAIVKLRDVIPHQSTSSFLIRLNSTSDAVRLTRRWHRSVWNDDALHRRPTVGGSESGDSISSHSADDAKWKSGEMEEEEEIGSGHFKLREGLGEAHKEVLGTNPGHVIDARIMY